MQIDINELKQLQKLLGEAREIVSSLSHGGWADEEFISSSDAEILKLMLAAKSEHSRLFIQYHSMTDEELKELERPSGCLIEFV